ncbi:MAG: sigma 54-interacting transcriptional regulator, partial [Bacillota bacterium]
IGGALMLKSPELISKITDLIDEGLIIVDRGGVIRLYNDKARRIFRVDPPRGPGHNAGVVLPGDVVLLADNELGRDDGSLTAQDLAYIGIDPRGVVRGSSIVGCGVVGGPRGSAVWQVGQTDQDLAISTMVNGLTVRVALDGRRRQFSICVGDEEYPYRYQVAAAHLVVLDPNTGVVKFYQTRGYTARREDARAIIFGVPYRAKGDDSPRLNLIGRHILEVHPEGVGIKGMMEILAGASDAGYARREYEINGWPVRCSLHPLEEEGKIVGAVLLVEDITELKLISSERDQAVALVSQLEKQAHSTLARPEGFTGLTGHHPKFTQALTMAARATQSSSTVLLLGDSGTGKGVLARAIHDQSHRRSGPFIYVNCAAIPETLLESELFGYDEGAFTGARRSGKPGSFEMAHRGSIFLDEIGELSLPLQAKLLHVIQHKTIRRVGGVEEIRSDTRIIAASNRNLEVMVKEGRFREDLFYRLNVLPIRLPSLRERGDDILELAETLLPKVCETVGVGYKQLNHEVMQALMSYQWPGNIRELENVLERCVNLAEGEWVTVQHLPDAIQEAFMGSSTAGGWCEVKRVGALDEMVQELEHHALVLALTKTQGNKQDAQKLLGLKRSVFYDKLKRHGLTSSRKVD